jgi:3-dehydroquinate synthase
MSWPFTRAAGLCQNQHSLTGKAAAQLPNHEAHPEGAEMARPPDVSIRSPLREVARSAVTVQRFALDYTFPVYFTWDVFAPANPIFLDTLTRLEPDRRHRFLFVLDAGVAAAHPALLDQVECYTDAHGARLELAGPPLVVPGGEDVKQGLTYACAVLDRMNELGIDRQSFLVACGGGAVLDVTGFAASLCHRGVRTVRLPTTVLSQADSAVGVKNGVNLFGKKNFAGAFQPPFGVINDSRFLDTLEPRDRIGGISEAIKVALVRDPAFFEQIEVRAAALARGDADALVWVIRRSAELHLQHIRTCGDPFELGTARPLDFGHWSAHKLEAITRHRVRHGEAVAIGLALDLTYATLAGHLAAGTCQRILSLLEAVGLTLWDDEMTATDEDGQVVLLRGLEEFREHLGGVLQVTFIRDVGEKFDLNEIDSDLMIDAMHVLQERAARCSSRTA